MTATKLASVISPAVTSAVKTSADTDSTGAIDRLKQEQMREQWANVEGTLIDWGCDPSQLDEEGTATPSRLTIQQAIGVANLLMKNGSPTPTRVVPDVRGRIVFEFDSENGFSSWHVTEGSVEYRLVLNHRLVSRKHYALERPDHE